MQETTIATDRRGAPAAGASGLCMEFEPHLPETSCTVRMRWK